MKSLGIRLKPVAIISVFERGPRHLSRSLEHVLRQSFRSISPALLPRAYPDSAAVFEFERRRRREE